MIDRYTITATTPAGHPLDVTDLDVKLADTWSPYVQGTSVCKLPPAPVVSELDPRQGTVPVINVLIIRHFGDDGNSLAEWTKRAAAPTVKVSELTALGANKVSWGTGLANHWNGGPVNGQQLALALPVDALATDERAGTLTLDIGGKELRLQDAVNEHPVQLTGQNVRDGLNDLLGRLRLGYLVSGGETPFVAPLWPAGQSAWDLVNGWLGDSGERLICDEAGHWRVISRDRTTPAPPVTLAGLTTLSRRLTRQDWHDGVAVIWKWQGPNPDNPTGDPVSFTYVETYGGNTWTRPLVVEQDAQYPGPYLAQYLWEREHRKGETHAYSAPADLTVRPLHTVAITDSVGTRDATITSVALKFPDATLTIETRER